MNETLKTIFHRRSIRKYAQKQITNEELQLILDAGCYAPSAMNQQSWHFVVIQKKELIEEIVFLGKTVLNKGAAFAPFYGAPTLVLAFGDSGAISPISDTTLAMENMFLAADSIGLGTCWINFVISLFATEEGKSLQQRLGVPQNYQSVGSFVLGYPEEEPQPKPRAEGKITVIR